MDSGTLGSRAAGGCQTVVLTGSWSGFSATLKGWRLLWKLRCSTDHITPVVKAVVLHHGG
ncbi:hypothetical protein GCM10010282_66820 [Streptomyces roseolus]|nr:hypothetical protein GCM10010282_66820 [Streptomyces roseolus]